MLSKQYGCTVNFLDTNTMRCALSLAPPLYNNYCIKVDMLFTTVGHNIDGNYESWKYMGKNWRGTVLPQVGGAVFPTPWGKRFFCAVQIMHILFSYFIFSLKRYYFTLLRMLVTDWLDNIIGIKLQEWPL